jgi:hypothetical protein
VASPNDQGYALQDGLIRLRGRIWVGANTALQTKIIQAFHSSVIGGTRHVLSTDRVDSMFRQPSPRIVPIFHLNDLSGI